MVSNQTRRGSRAARLVTVLAVVATLVPLSAAMAHAATSVTVSLAFDDEISNQYTLGYQHALLPHGAHATFYVNSGIVGGTNKLSWTQLQDLATNGNEVGGKGVNGVNLTTVGAATATAEVCNDRQALIAHGLNPISFAYPFGARNATVKSIVASCGWASGRSSGSLSPGGPRYSGPNPPDDYYDIRAWSPNAQVTLAQLESLVTNAAANLAQGGWTPIVIQRVCDQGLDPNGYLACKTGAWVELADLNAFLDWMANAGQTGGAPAGTTIATVGSVTTASDVTPPVTSIACNGSPCTGTTYQGGTATVTMSATDAGSGVSSTHYTLDGSDPSLASPAYTEAISLGSGTTTVKFRSWDAKGNVEATKSQVVDVAPAPDGTPPTTTIVCDGNPCSATPYAGGTTVTLSATDNVGGTGVDKTYYTLDGSTPTTASPVYSGPIMLASNTAVMFFSTDRAGNAEAVQTQQISANPFPVVVSLTFDDQYENQWLYLRPLLLAHNMHATLYVITSDTNNNFSCCMTWDQLRTMQAEGNDIGGHGVDHLNLTDPGTTQQQKIDDVCGSRTDLVDNGITSPQSYAYPFGAFDANAESIVQGCGFLSSRAAGGISPSVTSPGPPWAESSPPTDRYALRAIDVDGNTDKKLADLEAFVTAAAIHGGGWVPMVFHQVCHDGDPDFDTCIAQFGVRDSVLGAFMDWLGAGGQPGGAPGGTTVQTVAQVMNGLDKTAPTTAMSCNGAACSNGWYSSSPVTVTLTATDNAGGSGVAATYYTTDGSTPTTQSTVYTGPFPVSATATVKFFSTDVAGNAEAVDSQLIQIDTTGPETTIACDGSACSSGWYTSSPVTVTLSATDPNGAGVDQTYYTTDGSTPTIQSTVYAGPVPVNATATVKFFSTDVLGNAEPVQTQIVQIDSVAPLTTITCNGSMCSSGWYASSPVTVTLSASDNADGSGLDQTYYTTDGSTPTTQSTIYAGPFPVNATATVKFFSTDVAGNAEAVNSQLIQIDTTGPVTTVACDGSACSSGWYTSSPVTVTLAATDNADGSGVDQTYYTTDGSTPTIQSTVYAGPFPVTGTTTVKFFSTDLAGNAEGVKTQVVQIDTGAPTTTAQCNTLPCATWYKANVSVTLAATDNPGGSGVDKTYYTTDGSTPTTQSTIYTGPFTVTATATVQFFSTDAAGNAEGVRSQAVQIDRTAPTVPTITCNAATCSTGWYGTVPVSVALAADDGGGSGVAAIYYTTNGSPPRPTSPLYTGPFDLSQTTTVKAIAVDGAGNVSAVLTRTIRIDAAAPTVSVTNPANGSSFRRGAKVTISATATDLGTGSGAPSGIASVAFYLDGTLLGTDTKGPYNAKWTVPRSLPLGAHTLTAVATDVAGNVTTSAPISITITA